MKFSGPRYVLKKHRGRMRWRDRKEGRWLKGEPPPSPEVEVSGRTMGKLILNDMRKPEPSSPTKTVDVVVMKPDNAPIRKKPRATSVVRKKEPQPVVNPPTKDPTPRKEEPPKPRVYRRNLLSQEDLIRVVDWLRENAEKLKEQRPSYSDAAKMCHEATKIEVSRQQIEKFAGMAGVSWDVPGRSDVAILADAIVTLYENLGVAVPPSLKDLAGK